MRKLLFLTLTIFSQATVVFASPNNEALSFEPCEKIYVHPEQLAMSKKGIFVKFDEQWFRTETLLSDIKGIFIQNLTPSAYGCPDPYNACRNCGRCVHEELDVCPYCNRPT